MFAGVGRIATTVDGEPREGGGDASVASEVLRALQVLRKQFRSQFSPGRDSLAIARRTDAGETNGHRRAYLHR